MINIVLHLYRRYFWSFEKYARFKGVKIGSNCNIQNVNFGSEPYLIEIGNHVQITNGTKIFTHGGGWVFRQSDPTFDYFGKVKIGNNVYIGNNVLIMPGVSIGNNVIVGAGSVVTKSVNEGSIVGGNPAKVIGNIDEYFYKIKNFNTQTKHFDYKRKKDFLMSLQESKFIIK